MMREELDDILPPCSESSTETQSNLDADSSDDEMAAEKSDRETEVESFSQQLRE